MDVKKYSRLDDRNKGGLDIINTSVFYQENATHDIRFNNSMLIVLNFLKLLLFTFSEDAVVDVNTVRIFVARQESLMSYKVNVLFKLLFF